MGWLQGAGVLNDGAISAGPYQNLAALVGSRKPPIGTTDGEPLATWKTSLSQYLFQI